MKRIKEFTNYKAETVGESWNQETLSILKDSPEPKSEIDKKLFWFFVDRKLPQSPEDGFTAVDLDKKYIKRLEVILRTKNKDTRKKRQQSIIREFFSHPYNKMLITVWDTKDDKGKTYFAVLEDFESLEPTNDFDKMFPNTVIENKNKKIFLNKLFKYIRTEIEFITEKE